ncbi:yippee zinc-binding protein Moh1 [Mucor ambiguus]|uniref:Yippee zinc-binding protein Moh1 n=1 Tax=Mucor ambiguus TaxID=91626 RepID=A0A0C9MEN0_9FUNG|nr:yippee zinc-binding protein Moh1 [Mucor ambiguus]
MGFTYRAYLDEEAKRCKIYACSKCSSHLSTFDYLISKDFHGVHGKAYLFENVVNIVVSHESEVSCSGCDEELGWKYASSL